MILFDKLEDALEDATWSAETYQRVFAILKHGDRYKVVDKYRLRKPQSIIEVGFRDSQ